MIGIRAAAAPLASPAFRRYLAGQLPSVTCSWAQVVTLSWVVVELDRRALGWVVALQFLPSLVLGPWFGAVADRHDRRRLLILAESGLGLVAAGYAVASASGALTIPLICLLATVWGIINALDTPARRALLPLLVRPDQAASASALAGTVLLLGMTAGSALGGVLVATVGATAAFAVNAASFLADVIVLHTIRAGASPLVRRAPRQVRDGLGYVWRTRALRTPLLTLAMLGTLAFSVQVSVPTLVRASFGGGAALLGVAFTAVTAGSLAGALLGAARGAPGPWSIARAAAIMAGAMVTVAVAPIVPVAIAGLAGVGLAWSLVLVSVIAVLQTADPRMLGRVMSLFAVVLLGGTAAGGPIAASMAAAIGPRAPFLVGAGAAVAAIVITRARRGAGPEAAHNGGCATTRTRLRAAVSGNRRPLPVRQFSAPGSPLSGLAPPFRARACAVSMESLGMGSPAAGPSLGGPWPAMATHPLTRPSPSTATASNCSSMPRRRSISRPSQSRSRVWPRLRLRR